MLWQNARLVVMEDKKSLVFRFISDRIRYTLRISFQTIDNFINCDFKIAPQTANVNYSQQLKECNFIKTLVKLFKNVFLRWRRLNKTFFA